MNDASVVLVDFAILPSLRAVSSCSFISKTWLSIVPGFTAVLSNFVTGRWQMILGAVWTCIFLILIKVDYLFTCLKTVYSFCVYKVYVHVPCPFSIACLISSSLLSRCFLLQRLAIYLWYVLRIFPPACHSYDFPCGDFGWSVSIAPAKTLIILGRASPTSLLALLWSQNLFFNL